MRRLLPVGVAALLLSVYLLTMAPTLSWAHHGADGGDLVTAVALGTIPHPPGFPTYLLLGEMFIGLPWGDPAWRLNLLSAVAAAGAAGLTAAAVGRLRPGGSPLGALGAGLCLGLAPLFWSQALIVEVYAVAALLSSALILLTVGRAPGWARGVMWGLGMGVHPTLVFLAPLVMWGAVRWWSEADGGRRGLTAALPPLLEAGLAAVLGWGAMVGPALLARDGALSPWGDPSTLSGWWALVSARMYRGYLFALPLAAWPQRLLAWVGLLARQFTPVGAILTGVGWLALRRQRRPLAASSLVSFAALSLFALSYDTADSLVYLVPGLPLAALWLGCGFGEAAERLRVLAPASGWLLLVLPLAQLLFFWGAMDLSGDWTALAWAHRVLDEAPPRAVLITAEDRHTFTLWYAHDVLGSRADVVIIDADLWAQPSYRALVARRLAPGGQDIAAAPSAHAAARRSARPVVDVGG